MIKTIDTYITQSLGEYLKYNTMSKLEAFKTVTGELYPYQTNIKTSPSGALLNALGSVYSSWAYDNSINSVVVPTGLAGFPAAQPDYRHGRFLLTSGAAPTGLSATFTVPDFNVYLTSSPESKLIFETDFGQAPDYSVPAKYADPSSVYAPCIWVKSYQTELNELCLGGGTNSEFIYKIIVFARSESQLLGVQSIIRDSKQCIFPILRYPVLDQLNNLQFSSWTYPNAAESEDEYCLITDTTCKISENDLFVTKNPALYILIGNIEVSYFGHARQGPPNLDLTLLQYQNGKVAQMKQGPAIEL